MNKNLKIILIIYKHITNFNIKFIWKLLSGIFEIVISLIFFF
jgi:hypothetical protein